MSAAEQNWHYYMTSYFSSVWVAVTILEISSRFNVLATWRQCKAWGQKQDRGQVFVEA
jgi:hypothetical protein